MKRIVASGLIVLMVMTFCSFAYGNGATDTKLERGGKNLALGWTEIPKRITDTTKEKNILVGLTVGAVEGLFNAVARTVSGIADIVTLPVRGSDKQVVKPKMAE